MFKQLPEEDMESNYAFVQTCAAGGGRGEQLDTRIVGESLVSATILFFTSADNYVDRHIIQEYLF
jgi:hypothetical protein